MRAFSSIGIGYAVDRAWTKCEKPGSIMLITATAFLALSLYNEWYDWKNLSRRREDPK